MISPCRRQTIRGSATAAAPRPAARLCGRHRRV